MKKLPFSLLGVTFLLFSCGPTNNEEPKDFTYSFSGIDKYIDIHTDLQQEFLDDPTNNQKNEFVDGKSEKSKPVGATLEWTFDGPFTPSKYEVSLSERKDMKEAKVYKTTETSVDFINFKIGTDYYYTVKSIAEDGTSRVSDPVKFTTEDDLIRNVEIDGMSNCRDLGGKDTVDGGRINQGLIYRTARVTSSYGTAKEITEKGIDQALDLGLKTEIDLRGYTNENGGITECAIPDASYIYAPMTYDNIANYMLSNSQAIREVFRTYGDEDNYPCFFHCSIGTDRTGIVGILTNGLLGVSKDDLYRDYLFSNFGNIGKQTNLNYDSTNSVVTYVGILESYAGDSLAVNIYNYLRSIGVTKDEIYTLIDLMKDGGEDVFDGIHPLYVDATEFESEDLELTTSANNLGPQKYMKFENNVGKSFEFSFNLTENATFDIMPYMAYNNGGTRFNTAVAVLLDGEEITVTDKTFTDLYFRGKETKWVPDVIATIDGKKGDHTLTFIANGSSSPNFGAVTLVPHSDTTISLLK